MSKTNAMNKLSIKISRDDMQLYTDEIYQDMADPALNGITTHSNDATAHNLPAQFAAIDAEIDRIDDELATKVGSVDLSGKADVAGDTFTGTVNFEGGDQAVVINGPEQTDRSIRGKTAGANRWEVAVASNDDEMGANSGSNLVVARYDDSGNFLGIPFAIDRQTGVTYIDQLSVGGGDLLVGEGVDVRVQSTEPTVNLKIGTVWVRPCGTSGGGPVGVLPTYGMICHLDANNAQMSGQVVASIPDSSTANNQAAAAGSPNLVQSATPSGQPAVIGGLNSFLTLSSTMWSGKSAGHIFVYLRATGTGILSGPWRMGGNNVDRFSDGTIEASSMRSTSYATVTPAVSHKNSWRIFEISGDGTQKVYMDGVLLGSTANAFSGGSSPYLLRGSENYGTDSMFAFADFIAYDRVLTAQEAGDVRQWLIDKNGATGPVSDKQYDAIMALSPWLYLPLTTDLNDYSGNNNHAQRSIVDSIVSGVPNTKNAPTPTKAYNAEPDGSNNDNYLYVSALPNYNALNAFSMSWWATRHVFGADAQTAMDMMLGSNLQVNFGIDGIKINTNGSWYGPIANTATSRSVMDHYCLTFDDDINDGWGLLRFYINGNIVYELNGAAMPTNGGASMLFQRGTDPNAIDGWGQHFAFFNTCLTESQVQVLTNARIA